MWSARGLSLDDTWQATIGSLRGFNGHGGLTHPIDSIPTDHFFMFDQAIIWVASLNAAASIALETASTRLTRQQWEALQAVTYRLIEQLDAIRMLFLAELPTPAMQIARAISEDVDMALAFVARPKLARRFVDCNSVVDANEFWRRHIAGGRAFKAVSERLYQVGLEFDQSGEYAAWRREVKAILGTAVHTSFRVPETVDGSRASGRFHETCACLYFVTMRLQELCAYSHVLQTDFGEDLATVARSEAPRQSTLIGTLTARMSEITVDQLRWSLANGSYDEATSPSQRP